MSPHVHLVIDGDASPPLLASGLTRFGVPHRVVDLRTLDGDDADGAADRMPALDLAAWGPRAGIVACLATGDAADRLCRHLVAHGIAVLHFDGTNGDKVSAAAMAGTLGGLLDRLTMAAAPAA